ncbi:MAG TPA: hypothetical protein VMI52_14725 [Acetobacteraceae bacterium]|nr:hypothetical protein [Acetobacteraceae bacterium]
MAATAEVIDLNEVRRRRQATAPKACPETAAMPMAWVPVWFFVPVWPAGFGVMPQA